MNEKLLNRKLGACVQGLVRLLLLYAGLPLPLAATAERALC